RVPDELEAAVKGGKNNDWYDDALYFYAEWMENTGTITQQDSGEWRQEPDYAKALQAFRRLVTEFKKGETRYYDQAEQEIKNITNSAVGVYSPSIFLPDSEVQLGLSWRNVKKIDLRLFKIDLPRDVRFTNKETNGWSWITQIDIGGLNAFKAWTHDTNDDGTHKPGQEMLRLDSRLPVGAYLVVANAGGAVARDVILVTDASLVLKASGKQALVYFCDAIEGAPLPNAEVTLWDRTYDNKQSQYVWYQRSGRTDSNGLVRFELAGNNNYDEIFV